ncbi:MAG TPA: AAA family ATPase [Acidimicrobiia bacterium]|nr:AAA family ATPase [Acidimicrobiia bacterium]
MTQGVGEAGRPATATVLFTDLVGSTALRQAVGDDAADELRRSHDRVLRDAVAAHGGHEVKGTGDGLMIVFDSAVEAVAAAEAMQRGVERLTRRAPAPVSIRVGLSAGDVVWEGDDCFGTPVVEARRLCDSAEGAQILVGDVVRILAGSRGGHDFRPIGALELKGLTAPVPAAEVAWQVGDHAVPLPSALAGSETIGLVGRVDEMERLWTAWKHARSGEKRLVLLSGEPGVGKTRLAAELARRAHAEGAAILFGRCDDDLAVPYQPFVEALRAYVNACAPADLEVQVGSHGGDVARLVPELAAQVTGLSEPLHADPETERYRLFEAVDGFLEGAAANVPVVLLLDDLHWAAKPTLLMLRHLVRSPSDASLLVVGTYRDTELDRRHPLAEMLADLRRDETVERMALRGLDEGEVTAFVEAAADQPLSPEVAALAHTVYAETEGNPFFVGQVLRHLVESGAVVQEDGQWVRTATADRIGIPEGVREVISRRLATLDDESNAVLTVAAVIGRDFDAELLTEATEVDPERVLDALETAEEGRLVEATPGRARFTFVHALVRSTLYDEIPTTRRLRLHRRVAQALEPRAAGDENILPSLARHYCEAAGLGETDKAIRYATEAAERAFARLAYEEAAELYERALTVLEPRGADERKHRGDLLIRLAEARWASGDQPGARRTALEAAQQGREVGRPDLVADAAILFGGIRVWTDAGVVDGELIALCEEALDALPATDSPRRAKVLARLAGELYFLLEASERRRALTDDAVAMARRVADPAVLAYVLGSAHWGMWTPGTAHERLAIAEEMLQLGRRAGNRGLEAGAAQWAFGDLMELGDTDRADEMLAVEQTIAAELNHPDYLWNADVHQCLRELMDGRYDAAAKLAEEALAHGQVARTQTALMMYGVAQFEQARARGGIEALEPLAVAMVEQYPLLPAWRSGLAYAYAMLEKPDDARAQVDVIAANGFDDLPTDANWPIAVGLIIIVCAFVGDAERAGRLYDMLLPYREYFVMSGMPALSCGSAELFLGLAAATTGRWQLADEHFALAVERNARSGNRAWSVHGMYEYARLLARRGDPGDAQRLHDLLRDCLAGATEMGMTRVVDQTNALAANAGINLD